MSQLLEYCQPIPRARERSLGIAWWAVVSRFLVHGLVVSTWVSRIPAVKTSLGLSDAALGLALLGIAVGSLAGIPFSGWLVARTFAGRLAERVGILAAGSRQIASGNLEARIEEDSSDEHRGIDP